MRRVSRTERGDVYSEWQRIAGCPRWTRIGTTSTQTPSAEGADGRTAAGGTGVRYARRSPASDTRTGSSNLARIRDVPYIRQVVTSWEASARPGCMPAHRFAGERREQQMRMAVASRGCAVDVGKAMALFASATI